MKSSGNNWRGFFSFVVAGLLTCFSFPADAAGPAFTGLAAKADTAETVYLNPAGMSLIKKPSWYGNPQVMYIDSSTEFTVQGQSDKLTIQDDGFILIPGLYYVRPLNDRWSFGIGPNAASGRGATYNDTWPGRYLLKEWSQLSVGVVPSVAYRANDKLSIGFSLSLNYSVFTMEKAMVDPGQSGDGNFKLEADGIGVGGNLGFLYQFNPNTRIGIVYRSEVVAENEGTPEVTGLSTARRTALENAGALNQEISMDTNIPQSMMVGVFQDFNNGWTMSADVVWVDFSAYTINNINIGNTAITKDSTADYKDIWAYSLGTTYDLTHDWKLRGGILYVSSALEDEDRTLLSRYDAMWAIGGGVEHAFRSGRKVAVDLTYYQFGDGEFTVNAPVVGSISGEYVTNYGISLGVSTYF
jgi:long-chain fatty acid transport protein